MTSSERITVQGRGQGQIKGTSLWPKRCKPTQVMFSRFHAWQGKGQRVLRMLNRLEALSRGFR